MTRKRRNTRKLTVSEEVASKRKQERMNQSGLPRMERRLEGSSFDILQKKEWLLDWNCVKFRNGYFVVLPPADESVRFKPKAVGMPEVIESYNYLKDYLNSRLEPVHCSVEAMEITIYDTIRLDEAIQKFAAASKQKMVKVGDNEVKAKVTPQQMTFKQALSKAQQMTTEEFQKYKSEYIDFLVANQSERYKIIPCVERLTHIIGDTTEYAFMFSLECKSGDILIVHENVNPDRSTLLFLVNKEEYNVSVREIYSFLQSAETNKRSNLREGNIEIYHKGISHYRSINHDDIYSWKHSILQYKKDSVPIERPQLKHTVSHNEASQKMTLSKALKELKSNKYWKAGVSSALKEVGIMSRPECTLNRFLELVPKNLMKDKSTGHERLGLWRAIKVKDSHGQYKDERKFIFYSSFSVEDIIDILAQNGIVVTIK